MYVSLCPPSACKPTHPVILPQTARAESLCAQICVAVDRPSRADRNVNMSVSVGRTVSVTIRVVA